VPHPVADVPEGGRIVAVAGEVLTDLVPAGEDGLFHAVPGGSPANVAVGLSRLGVTARMLARLGPDALGRRLRSHLEVNGVRLDRAVTAEEPSSLAVVSLGPDGAAEYDFRVDGTADWQWTDDELAEAVDDDVDALHVGSLAMLVEPGAAALHRLVERVRPAATISYDPNVRPALMGDRSAAAARVERLVALADVVKASTDDLAWLYPGVRPVDVARDWLAAGPSLVVVTRGGDGVLAAGRAAGELHRPAVPVVVRDTVGAGDAFMAGLLHGLSDRGLLGAGNRGRLAELKADVAVDLLDDAALVAALTCARSGADPPTSAELREARAAG
jgi:fructokinase